MKPNITPGNNPEKDLRRQQELLKMEYDYEKEEFQRQNQMMGIERKIKRGMCWFPLRIGRNYYNSLNQLVVDVQRQEDKDIEHSFEYGKPVCFFKRTFSGEIQYFNFTAHVSYVNDDRMVVAIPDVSNLLDLDNKDDIGVQLYFDETSYKAMFEALRDVIRAKETRLAKLRDTLIGSAPPRFRDLFPIRFPWLNPTQESAVNNVLRAKDVAVVHGPPGTGKTTTLVEAIYETLHRENQVLVCAQSNTAVDWISEKLVDRGVPVLRIGNPTRVNDKMLSFTYERQFENHAAYPELWSIRKSIREVRAKMRKGNHENRDGLRNRLSKLKSRETELEILINEELFARARVISSTLVSSNHRLLMGRTFTSLFIDEAAQALEAACWIAIRKADRVILAGDHQQLPPTIKCYEAAREGLNKTLMEKISVTKPSAVSLLKVQYRMHESIMKFPSEWFYDNMLEAASEVRYRGILDYDIPITWYDTSSCDFQEAFVGDNFGRINKPEANLLLRKLQEYITHIGEHRILNENIDFGIISPYKAQVQYLKQKVRSSNFLHPLRRQITVHTVDGFQGQERDVIFISLVRANDKGQIGFLNDLRRMNVAITRARMKLVILGDASTLQKHPFYKEFIEYISKVGKVETIENQSI